MIDVVFNAKWAKGLQNKAVIDFSGYSYSETVDILMDRIGRSIHADASAGFKHHTVVISECDNINTASLSKVIGKLHHKGFDVQYDPDEYSKVIMKDRFFMFDFTITWY